MSKKSGNIYFDTNILRKMGVDIYNNPIFSNVRNLLSDKKMYIPEIVWSELEALRKKDVIDNISHALNRIERINESVNKKIILTLNKDEIINETINNLKEKITKCKITIFDTPFEDMSLESITNKAINKIKPFRDEGKGFKDMVILLAILKHSIKEKGIENIFVTDNLKDFDNDDVKEMIKEEKCNLKIFKSIERLNEYFIHSAKKAFQAWTLKRQSILKKFLFDKSKVIIEHLREKGIFTPDFFYSEHHITPYSIKELRNVKIVDILEPIASFPKEKKEQFVEISFRLKLKIEALIDNKYGLSPTHSTTTLMMTNSSNLLESFNIVETEKEVPIRGKALVKFDGKGNECYSDLQLYEVQKSLFEAFLYNQVSWKRNE